MDGKDILKYKQMLLNESISHEEIGEFTSHHFPKPIYRYRRFGEFWEDDLLHGKIHMSKSSTLNDPFECLVYVNERDYVDAIKAEASKIVLPKVRENIISREANHEYLEQEIKKMQEIVRVASFTEINNSLLMWGHYAESHKGFCIEYDFSRVDSICQKYIFPVIYSKRRYDATDDIISIKKNNYINPFLFKYDLWKYEAEWRLLWPTEKQKKEEDYYFDLKKLISGVYLGVNILKQPKGETYYDKILKWAKDNRKNVYQMQISNEGYELSHEKIL